MKIVLMRKVRKLSDNPTFRHREVTPAEKTLARNGLISGKSLTIYSELAICFPHRSNRSMFHLIFSFSYLCLKTLKRHWFQKPIKRAGRMNWVKQSAQLFRKIRKEFIQPAISFSERLEGYTGIRISIVQFFRVFSLREPRKLQQKKLYAENSDEIHNKVLISQNSIMLQVCFSKLSRI